MRGAPTQLLQQPNLAFQSLQLYNALYLFTRTYKRINPRVFPPESALVRGTIRYPLSEAIPLFSPSGFFIGLNGNETITLPWRGVLVDVLVQSYPRRLTANVTVALESVWLLGTYRGSSRKSRVSLEILPNLREAQGYSIFVPPFHILAELCPSNSFLSHQDCQLLLSFRVSFLAEVFLGNGTQLQFEATHSQVCPPHCTRMNSGGIIAVTKRCQGYHHGPECSIPSLAHDSKCSFGSAPACRPCPRNSACPGGFRAWPGTGFWTPDESSGEIYRCPPPAEARCLGWESSQAATMCGQTFDPGVPLCGSCDRGYFLVDGVCTPCQANQTSTSPLSSGLTSMIAVAGGALGTYGVLALVMARALYVAAVPTSRGLSFRIAADVMVWLISSMQVLLQLSRVELNGFPPFGRHVFNAL